MSLESNLTTALTAVGTEFKTVKTYLSGSGTGDVSGLATAATNLVAAVNEVKITADAAAGGGVAINDAVTNLVDAWSSQKITDEIAAAVSGILAGAPGALDTLNELAAALGDDANFAATVTADIATRVSTVAAQGLTGGQQTNARDNIGVTASADIGDTNRDFAADFAAALT